ncbi:aminotransferase class I/II-fold pyridoxal phosphate-dependent enzyme [Aquirufa sp. ROCK2-A2]
MKSTEEKLADILKSRQSSGLLRSLQIIDNKIDFCSNDYLGLAKNIELANLILSNFEDYKINNRIINGSTGSRLISGNSELTELFEKECAAFHQSESALLFGSGFEANLGLLSCVPQEGDVLFCDKLLHASLIDGLKLNKVEKRIFKHNDLNDLIHLLNQYPKETPKWIIVESIYSMDGDEAPIDQLIELKNLYNAEIIVDEAHSGGIYGLHGEGKCVEKAWHPEIFARIITFGKAWGNSGAVVLGSKILREYLVNFARTFIYSTAPSPAHVCSLLTTLHFLRTQHDLRIKLTENIHFFRAQITSSDWGKSQSAIQTFFVKGNDAVREKARLAQEKGFAIKPIVYPTVAKGKERIRITLSSETQKEDMLSLINILEK